MKIFGVSDQYKNTTTCSDTVVLFDRQNADLCHSLESQE